MFDENKIDVHSSPEALEITLKWFTPKAIFLAFFSIFWMGFLAVWYYIAFTTGGPLIMKLIPILHLLVGLYLTYTTLCYFFNKTYLDVRDDYLTVAHRPIPWWKGNLDIATSELKQLYVTQKTSNGKKGTSYSYTLRAKLFNGDDIEVLAIPELSNVQLKQIEEHIENYLGIEDEPVKGEHGNSRSTTAASGSTKTSAKVTPRKQRRSFSKSNLAPLYFLTNGDSLSLKGQDLELINVTQFDWSDGNSDQLFQLISYQKREQLIYVEQNLALLNAYEIQKLSLLDVGNVVFNAQKPEEKINYQGEEYLLKDSKQGKKFMSPSQNVFEAAQFRYQLADGDAFIQVIASDNTIQYSLLTALSESDFEGRLDLNNLPEREIDYRAREIDDEDLV